MDIVKKLSKYGFDETCQRIQSFLNERNIKVFTIIDHEGNAEKVNLKLRPEKLILFGSPAIGTHIMQENFDAGLFLPSKVLVYEDQGKVITAHEDYRMFNTDLDRSFHQSTLISLHPFLMILIDQYHEHRKLFYDLREIMFF